VFRGLALAEFASAVAGSSISTATKITSTLSSFAMS